jgi:beta-glucosidase
MNEFKPYQPPISYEQAGERANSILKLLSIEEKILLIGGHDMFFTQGFEQHHIPQFFFSDATQGVHIRKELPGAMEKSTAFPCPIALSATWNTELARAYATGIGEECTVGGIAVLLGPGMNLYRISQCGRNFEYFGEDPFLSARMIENYVVGVQSTGTIATLKHFLCNNTDHRRRMTDSIVDERALHEMYLPAFQAGIDAGAMAVMTSYNKVNGEYPGQSKAVITDLLRNEMGFKWLVMTDWWSVYDPEKVIKSGQDLEMPGHTRQEEPMIEALGDVYVRSNAARLLKEGTIIEADIDRMAKSIIRTFIAAGMYDRPIRDEKYTKMFSAHEELALKTAREAIVLLRNEGNILPIAPEAMKKIVLTGEFVEVLAEGGGSAKVEGYDHVTMLAALTTMYGDALHYVKEPTDHDYKNADIVLISVGTHDCESVDRPFDLPAEMDARVQKAAAANPNTVVIVNSGGGVNMSKWNEKVKAILYAWYPGQNGNTALSEILAGKVSPSGKLPFTIEKRFEDSPGYGYKPEGEAFDIGTEYDMRLDIPLNTIEYKESIFTGYRWYESKNITPLYHFGSGLTYSGFEFTNITLSDSVFPAHGMLQVSCELRNTGKVEAQEVVQLYIRDEQASVPRPVKELKGFRKVHLAPGARKTVAFVVKEKDLAFWDTSSKSWKTEKGNFTVLIGSSSNDIMLTARFKL